VRQALFLLMAIALVAGCGGGGGGTRLTKEEYASKADAICGKYNRQVRDLSNPQNLSELEKVADQTLSILANAITDLKKLNPPASEQAKADQWLSQVENLKEDLTEIRDGAKDQDMKAVQAVLPKAEEHNRRSNALATELGMTVCNSD
jgi:chromosome segregation ATPase